MKKQTFIEVYEWKEGQPRPGTVDKARNAVLDMVEPPPDGMLPQPGDIILLNDPFADDYITPVRYKVVEREFMWIRTDKDTGDPTSPKPASFVKVWIHVRKLKDETK